MYKLHPKITSFLWFTGEQPWACYGDLFFETTIQSGFGWNYHSIHTIAIRMAFDGLYPRIKEQIKLKSGKWLRHGTSQTKILLEKLHLFKLVILYILHVGHDGLPIYCPGVYISTHNLVDNSQEIKNFKNLNSWIRPNKRSIQGFSRVLSLKMTFILCVDHSLTEPDFSVADWGSIVKVGRSRNSEVLSLWEWHNLENKAVFLFSGQVCKFLWSELSLRICCRLQTIFQNKVKVFTM